MDTRAPESSSRGHWRLDGLNSFHDSASGPGPWVFLFRSTAWECVPPRTSVRSADSNSTINARVAHPLEPLHNITPSNLFCFFSPFIVPAKPRLSPDNGCHQPTRERHASHTHTQTHADTRALTRTRTSTSTCSCLLPAAQCPSSRPRATKQSGHGSCHLELNPPEPHAESLDYPASSSLHPHPRHLHRHCRIVRQMSPPPAASTPSPASLSLQYHQSNSAGANGSSASPAADTVNVSVKTQHDDSMMLDDGEQRQSGDEGASGDDDDVAETVNRNGKRKRPISVSYVHYFSCISPQACFSFVNVSFSSPLVF